jgi:SAM-dependent methyltransferase
MTAELLDDAVEVNAPDRAPSAGADSCPVCDSADTVWCRRGVEHHHYPIEGRFDTRRCCGCGVEWVSPIPGAEQIGTFYPLAYYAHDADARTSAWQRLVRLSGLRVRSKEPWFRQAGRMLDVGCGTGDALKRYAANGWSVCGINFAITAGRTTLFGTNIPVILDDFLSHDFGGERFDYIRMNHTLEHLPQPRATLAKAFGLLRPGGTLLVAVPNSDSWAYRRFGEHWWNYGVPCHLYVYNRGSIEKMLKSVGFEVCRFTLNSDYASITGSLQIMLNRNSGLPSNVGWLFRSKLLRVCAHVCAKLLDLLGRGDCMEITVRRPEVGNA